MSSLFLQQEFTELRVEEAPEERRPEESPRPGSSSSSAEDHLHPNSHGTPEHLSSRPSLLLRNSSTDASSSSSFSRKSSIRSTDSVAAVPVKTPLRTPVQTPAVSRCPSNIIRYPGFPGTATSSRAPSMPCSPDHATNLMHTSAPGAAVYPGPSASISASANRLASPPPKRPRLPSHIHSDPPVTFYEPALSNAPSPATSSRNPSLPPTPSLYSARASKLDARLDPPAAAVTQRRSAEDFDFGPILGEGSYSTVFQVTEKADPSKSYALKVLDKRHIVKEKKQKYVTVEKDTLYRLERHPGIVRLFWTFHDERSLYFVLELANNGELLKCIKRNGSFSCPVATHYAAQILSAVEHMHARGVIHRDLKPENILLDHKMRVKITDFGTAKLLEKGDDRANSFVGTAEYVSPELLTAKTAFKASDFWALGCIIFQMMAGKPPFKAPNEYLTFQKIINLEYDFPQGFSEEGQDLIQKLLVSDPTKRLGADAEGISAIKQHAFFSDIDWSTLWTQDPPPIVTGLMSPPPPPDEDQLRGAIDDYFSFAPLAPSSTRESIGSYISNNRSLARRHVESIDSSGSSAAGGVGAAPVVVEDSEAKWARVLLPREQILLSGAIMSRSTIFNKRRFLILTDYPRLLVCRVHKASVRVKHEILFGTDTPLSAAWPTTFAANAGEFYRTRAKQKEDDGPALQTFVTVVEDGPRFFRLATNLRGFKFEDASGTAPASRWVAAIRQTQQSSYVREPSTAP